MCTAYDVAPEEAPTLTPSFLGPYLEAALRRPEEVSPCLDNIMAAMADRAYPLRDRMAVRMALEEAVVNGLRHGNRGDPAKEVRVGYFVGPDAVFALVEDEGSGFDPGRVPDPTLPENLDRSGGRGLLLMRRYMTWVRFCGRGNRVMMCKRLST